MLHTEKQHALQSQNHLACLHQRYSAALLGYILGIVQDRQQAEFYLIQALSRFVIENRNGLQEAEATWLDVLQYTRKFIAGSDSGAKQAPADRSQIGTTILPQNQHLDRLNSKEKEIFCAIYYHGKSIAYLSATLDESESAIRNQFKLSLDKIRNAHGN